MRSVHFLETSIRDAIGKLGHYPYACDGTVLVLAATAGGRLRCQAGAWRQ